MHWSELSEVAQLFGISFPNNRLNDNPTHMAIEAHLSAPLILNDLDGSDVEMPGLDSPSSSASSANAVTAIGAPSLNPQVLHTPQMVQSSTEHSSPPDGFHFIAALARQHPAHVSPAHPQLPTEVLAPPPITPTRPSADFAAAEAFTHYIHPTSEANIIPSALPIDGPVFYNHQAVMNTSPDNPLPENSLHMPTPSLNPVQVAHLRNTLKAFSYLDHNLTSDGHSLYNLRHSNNGRSYTHCQLVILIDKLVSDMRITVKTTIGEEMTTRAQAAGTDGVVHICRMHVLDWAGQNSRTFSNNRTHVRLNRAVFEELHRRQQDVELQNALSPNAKHKESETYQVLKAMFSTDTVILQQSDYHRRAVTLKSTELKRLIAPYSKMPSVVANSAYLSSHRVLTST